jgi:hypothetical protein
MKGSRTRLRKVLPEREREEAAVPEAIERLISRGPPAGSGIPFEAWGSWHRYGFIACPGTCRTRTQKRQQNIPLKGGTDFRGLSNSGHRDHSRLSCGGGETQLGLVPGSQPGFLRGRSVIEAHRRHCKNFCRSRDDPAAAN